MNGDGERIDDESGKADSGIGSGVRVRGETVMAHYRRPLLRQGIPIFLNRSSNLRSFLY